MTTEKKNQYITKICEDLNNKKIPYIICAVTDEEQYGALMAMNLQSEILFGLAMHKIMETIARHSGTKPSEVAEAIYETEKEMERRKC